MTKVRIETQQGDAIKEVEVNHNKPLLKQLEAQGIEIPNACNIGMCAACMCHSQTSDELLNKSLRGEPAFPLGEGEIMTCIGGVIQTEETVVLRTMN